MKAILLTLTLASGLLLVNSCKSKKPVEKAACAITPTFTADIKPIFDLHCASTCHSAEKKKDGVDLSTYATSKVAAAEKRFMGSLNHSAGYAPMPMKKPKLDDATLQKIKCWIEGGMQE